LGKRVWTPLFQYSNSRCRATSPPGVVTFRVGHLCVSIITQTLPVPSIIKRLFGPRLLPVLGNKKSSQNTNGEKGETHSRESGKADPTVFQFGYRGAFPLFDLTDTAKLGNTFFLNSSRRESTLLYQISSGNP
jgi:hypothetical protein